MPHKKRGSEVPRSPLVWCQEEEGGARFLHYKDGWEIDMVSADTRDATLEELADLCDQCAENVNAHDFVGVHRLLAALLQRELGRDGAKVVMRHIAELGGLDGMNGICGQDNAFADLGVPEPWQDWKLA